MRPAFSFLHLSDIHFRHGDAEHQVDQRLVLGSLEEDIARYRDRQIPTPQAILVTGDIAFSGNIRHPEEYADAKRFLDRLCSKLSIPAREVYLVPGNHDVQRTGRQEGAALQLLEGLRTGRTSLDEALRNEADQALLQQRLANYRRFAAEYAPARASLPWTHHLVTESGLRVRLCSLPTALLANDNQDQGKLRIAKTQIEAIFAAPRDLEEVVIVLGHHPLQDGWLHDEEEVARWLRSSSNIYACGHIHAPWSRSERHPGQTHYWIPLLAGAVHGERRPNEPPETHSYQFATIFREQSGPLYLRVWPRLYSERTNRYVPDTERTEESQDYAEHLLYAPGRTVSSDLPDVQGLSEAVDQYQLDMANRIVLFRDLTSVLSSDGRSDAAALKLFVPQWIHRVVRDIKDPKAISGADSQMVDQIPVRADLALADCTNPWLLLTGPVGTGKSVLLRWIAHQLAKTDAETLGLPAGTVPILIELKAFQKSGLATFTDYFNQTNKGLDLCGEPLQRLEHSGRILWLLDGLDEITEANARQKCVDHIARLVATGRGRGIITSRPIRADYAKQRLPRVSLYSIHEYDLQDMLDFVRRWYTVMETDSPDGGVRRQELERALQADPRLFELCRSPLLLTLVCFLQRRAPLPPQRRQLYERALRTMITSWEQRKGTSEEDLPDPDLVLAFLRELAWDMHKGEQAALLMDQERLLHFAECFFRKQGRQPLQAEREAVRLVDALCSSGLLRFLGGNAIGFVHRTFQEYLAAQQVARELQDGTLQRSDLIALYRRRWMHSAWQETLALLCTELERDHAPDLIACLQAIAADLPLTDGDDLQFESFALRCMAELELQHPNQEPWHAFCGALFDVICCNVATLFSRIGFPNVEGVLLPALRRFGARWPDPARWRVWAFGDEIQGSFFVARGRAYRCLLAAAKPEDRAQDLRRILEAEGDRDLGAPVEAALQEMARLGWGLAEIQHVLSHLDQLSASAALLVLCALVLHTNVTEAAERLRTICLHDPDPGRRLRAAVALVASQQSQPGEAGVLRSLLLEPTEGYPAPRLDAVRALKEAGRNPAVHELLLEIAERDASLRQAAIVALKRCALAESEATELVAHAEEHPWAVADALGHSQQVPALVAIVQGAQRPRAKLHAALWLNRLGQVNAAQASLQELASTADDFDVRIEAADAWADIDDQTGEAYAQLQQIALADEVRRDARHLAANLLAGRRARAHLRPLLTSADDGVRLRAAIGLLGRNLSSTHIIDDDIEDFHQAESRRVFLDEPAHPEALATDPEATGVIAELAANASDLAVRFVAACAIQTEDSRRKAWQKLMAPEVDRHWRLRAAVELARPGGLDQEAYQTLSELSRPSHRMDSDAPRAAAYQLYLRQLFGLCRVGQNGRRGLVRLNGIPVGIFEEISTGSRFTYDSLYLLRDERKSLFPELALRSEPYESNELLSLLAHRGEEGPHLTGAEQTPNLAASEPFGTFLAACGDVGGVVEVQFIPEGTL